MKIVQIIDATILASLVFIGMTGCAKQTTEKPSVQGRWSGFESGGTEKITIEFKGNQFTYWDAHTNEIGSGTFVVNDSVEPNQMDLTFVKMPAPEYAGKTGLAVFELQGNEMKIAGAEPGNTARPASVNGGQGVRVFTFKRE